VAIIPVPDTGNPYTNGTNLHNALLDCVLGDRIQLVPNVEYRTTAFSEYLLRNKGTGTGTEADFIFIETNNMALLPEGVRVTLADAPKCARITTEGPSSIFVVAYDAHHWYLQGLDITTTSKPLAEGFTTNSAITTNASPTQSGPWPRHLVYDRCLIHPRETAHSEHFRALQRGLLGTGENWKLLNSSIVGFGGWSPPHAHMPGSSGDPYRAWVVSAATNATPCVVTLAGAGNTIPATGYPLEKRPIAFEGGIGDWAALNTTLCGDRMPLASATSNFDGTENPLSEGGVWTSGGAGLGALQKVSGHIRVGTVTFNCVMAYTGITWKPDQTSTVIRSATSVLTGYYAGAAVRLNVAAGNGYVFVARENTDYAIHRVDGATFVLLGAYAVTPALGDYISLSVVGPVLTASVNGTAVGQVTDPTYGSGATGMYAFGPAATVDIFDAWTATDIDDTHVSLQFYDPDTGIKTNVDSTSWAPFATSGPGGGQQQMIRLDMILNDASALSDGSGPGPVTITNSLLEASTYCILTGGGGGTYVEPQNDTTVLASPAPTINEVTLGELGDLAVGDYIAFEHSTAWPISAATNSVPCRITVPTHRYLIGKRIAGAWPFVRIRGMTGAWAGLNSNTGDNSGGQWYGVVASSTEIDLYTTVGQGGFGPGVDSTTWGAYPGGATWQPMSSLAVLNGTPGYEAYWDQSWNCARVTAINTGTNRVTHEFGDVGGVPGFANGNGSGVPVAAGSIARHNGLVPNLWTLRHTTLSQPRFWFWLLRDRCKTVVSSGSGPKGMWESKTCTNVSIEGCILGVSGGPLGTDDLGNQIPGSLLTFNQVNQTGETPWVSTSDWTVRYNLFVNGTGVFLGHLDEAQSSGQSQNFTLEHNLFTSSLGDYFGHHITGMKNLTIRHNTVRNGKDAFALIGESTNNIIKDNIYSLGDQGIIYHLDFTPYVGWEEGAGHVENNYIIDNKSKGEAFFRGGAEAGRYEADIYVASATAMQFVNLADADAGGDYHGYMLAAGSPGKWASITEPGKDVGVDFALLDAALAGAEVEPEPPYVGPAMRGGQFHNQIFRLRR
jgi:hypothetical protein